MGSCYSAEPAIADQDILTQDDQLNILQNKLGHLIDFMKNEFNSHQNDQNLINKIDYLVQICRKQDKQIQILKQSQEDLVFKIELQLKNGQKQIEFIKKTQIYYQKGYQIAQNENTFNKEHFQRNQLFSRLKNKFKQ